jgi:DNA-binding IclR family transcriptional regulator
MHCTSVGKAILAHLPSSVVHDILERKGLPVHTDKTITEKDEFLKELSQVRQKGFALDLEENEYGITCIAVPIFDHLGKVIAAVSISGPTMRMTDDRMNTLKSIMVKTGKAVSARLGHISPLC